MADTLKNKIYSSPVDVMAGDSDFDEKAIYRLDAHFMNLVAEKKLQSASYLIARHGKVFALKSMGKLTYHEDSSNMLPDSIFRIASITKVFAATAIMQLIEAGKLFIEEPVCHFIEEFNTEMHKGITVFHLLTHTSGITSDPGYFCEPYRRSWWEILGAQRAPEFPEEEKINWIKAIISGPLLCKPGEKWNYSSAAYMIAGEIISRASGIPCEQYIIDNIIGPLGLTDTFFDVPEEMHSRVCYTNSWGEKEFGRKDVRTNRPPRTSGGLYSTLYDLFRFGQMTLQKGTYNGIRIASRKAIEYMTRNHLGKNVPAFNWGGDIREYTHGIGFNISINGLLSPGTYNHEGSGRSMLYMDPAEDLLFAACVPTNTDWVPESVIIPRSIVWSGLL